MTLESTGIDTLKAGDFLYSPFLVNDDSVEADYEVRFEVFKFLMFTNIAIEDVAKANDNKYFAKMQYLGEMKPNQIFEEGWLGQKMMLADKQEIDKKDSTLVYKNIEFGFFNTPLLALQEFGKKLRGIADFVEAQEKEIKANA